MVDILAFGAHPDDIEFGCGGILAKEAANGKKIVLCDLTLGQKGSNGTPEERRHEGERAAEVIHATRVFLDFQDCEVIDSYENRLKLVAVLRQYKPKLVLAPYWEQTQNHPDHISTGLMARYACRYARFASILPELPIHTVGGILHYPPHGYGTPDFFVDITDHIDNWKKMMLSHASQMKTHRYDEWCLRATAAHGTLIGAGFAQGLIKGNPLVIDDLAHISNSTREL